MIWEYIGVLLFLIVVNIAVLMLLYGPRISHYD